MTPIRKGISNIVLALMLCSNASAQTATTNQPIKNIVLVHGAFLDGSGWEGVYNILMQKGYKVSIAAHAPDSGELRANLVKIYPSAYKSLIKGDDGFDYVDPMRFPEDFAADLPKQKAVFMANAQVPTADKVFGAVVQRAAWKYKPSWYMVATADRIINPDLERMYARRAKSTMVEISGASHAVYASPPIEVARLIVDASNNTR